MHQQDGIQEHQGLIEMQTATHNVDVAQEAVYSSSECLQPVEPTQQQLLQHTDTCGQLQVASGITQADLNATTIPFNIPDIFSAHESVVRNRGTLAAAAQSRQQQCTKQQELVQEWQHFSERQAQRYVPAQPDHSRQTLQETVCYRLRVLQVDNLPLISTGSTQLGLQLGVTLFDESQGQFYGSTCYSSVEDLQQQQQQQQEEDGQVQTDAVQNGQQNVGFCFDVMFHSAIIDRRCMAVVELILVERDGCGSFQTRFSAGWVQVLLFMHQANAAVAGLMNRQTGGGQAPATAPVMSGTPRYLQLRAVCGTKLPLPTVLGSCSMTYQVEAFPTMAAARALLPQDFLVCYSDVIPGLRRFDLAGQPSIALKHTLNTLANPLLAPTCAVSLDDVQLLVPQLLHNLLSVLPQLLGSVPPPELPTLLSVACQPDAVVYSMRVRLHNGRTFVGPWVTAKLQVQPHLGSLMLSPVNGQRLAVKDVYQDRLVVLLLELLATPTATAAATDLGAPPAAAAAGTVLVGRSVLAPFSDVAPDSSSATLDQGRHTLHFDSSSCMGTCKSSSCWAPKGCSLGMLAAGPCGPEDVLVPLNWRAVLGDTAMRSVPDAAVQLELRPYDVLATLGPEPAAATAATAGATSGEVAVSSPAPVSTSLSSTPAGGVDVLHIGSAAAAPLLPPQTVSVSELRSQPAEPAQVQHIQETVAARSLRLAAQHLEEAANIPVQTPSTTVCGDMLTQEQPALPAEAASQQQLVQLADAMQQQLDMLAQAVAELRQERQTLRSSLTLLESAAAAAATSQPPNSSMQSDRVNSSRPQEPASGSMQHSNTSKSEATGLHWIAAVPETGQHMDQVVQMPHQSASTPSRAVLQQLHEAGMTHALPTDLQAQLQAQAVGAANTLGGLRLWQHQAHPSVLQHRSRMEVLLLDVEARDPRKASDIVLQLLAFRPSPSPAAAMRLPSNLKSVNFTLQFYKFGPVATDTCLLVAADGTDHANCNYGPRSAGFPSHQQPVQQAWPAYDTSAAARSPTTLILVPPHHGSTPAGAGLVLKWQVDGSRQLRPGQEPVQAAAEAHLAFCKYLLHHKLAVDVWDGESLLQLGSCTVDLSGLLRQGGDLSDLLLELPVFKDCGNVPTQPAAAQHVGNQQAQVELGTMVVRLINSGREAINLAGSGRVSEAQSLAPNIAGKKVCVRAAPLEPGSPVAKALRGYDSPFAVQWQQASGNGSVSADGHQPIGVSASADAAAAAADIIGFEQRKLAREQCLRELLHSPSSSPKHRSSPGKLQRQAAGGQGSPAGKLANTWSAASPREQQQQQTLRLLGSPGSTWVAADGGFDSAEPFAALQRYLLSDVDAVRKRQKPEFIRSQVRRSLVTQCAIQPSPGQVLMLQHTLSNTLGHDAVFELRVSEPQELAPVESLQELAELQRALGTGINTAAAAAVTGLSGPQDSPGSAAAAAAAAGGGTERPRLKQLAQQAGARVLTTRNRVLLKANESVSIPLRFQLDPSVATTRSYMGPAQDRCQQQQQPEHRVTVDFVPLGLDWPLSILELAVQQQPAVVDRTFRYNCPERDVLHVAVGLADLPGVSAAVLSAAADGTLAVAASRSDVGVMLLTGDQLATSVGQTAQHAVAEQQQLLQQQAPQQESQISQRQPLFVCLRYRCCAAPEAVQFHLWLYADAAMAQPLETWQVHVNALQRVDMRATIGQQSTTTLAVAGGSVDRLVAVYSSHPSELQPCQPTVLPLPAGGMAPLGLVFKPRSAGQQRVCVHLVDVNSRQLVHALIVLTEAHLPQLHREMEVVVSAGSVSQHELEIVNTTKRNTSYVTATNVPWLLSIVPSVPQHVAAGTKAKLNVVCDARKLLPGTSECALVFIRDAFSSLQDEECVVISVRAT